MTALSLITFGGGFNLPLWAARSEGIFDRHGVELTLEHTPDSVHLMTGLIDGRYDLAIAAIDNLVAYVEGQGEAPTRAAADIVSVLWPHRGYQSLVVQPDIGSIAALRGRQLAVDAMTTGYAFLLRELVDRAGIAQHEVSYVRAGGTDRRFRDMLEGKHAATLMNAPFDLMAAERGLVILAGTQELLGPYQGPSLIVRRPWARENRARLVAFMRAYREAVHWMLQEGNRAAAETLLTRHDRAMTPALAAAYWRFTHDAQSGLAPDCAPPPEGIRAVLRLRAKWAEPRRELADWSKYVDTSYYEEAFGVLPT